MYDDIYEEAAYKDPVLAERIESLKKQNAVQINVRDNSKERMHEDDQRSQEEGQTLESSRAAPKDGEGSLAPSQL